MSYRIGSGYFGSDGIKTSSANQEIIQQHNTSVNSVSLQAYKLSFYNDQACHIKINNSSDSIYLRAGQGFEMNEIDKTIWSFVIVEAGISYNYIGAF